MTNHIKTPAVFRNRNTEAISSAMLWLLTLTCGMLIANVYYGQPLTGLISRSLGMPQTSAGLIVTLPLLGYGVGLLVLVPLGDLVENRRLILFLIGIEAAALLLITVLHRAISFLAAEFLAGAAASAVQVILPYVSHLMPEIKRGKALGRLVSGVMLGIMLARPLSCFIAGFGSWRMTYFMSACATLLLAITLRMTMLPRAPPKGPSYGVLMMSMVGIFRRNAVLRRKAIYHAAMFGAFSIFWTAAPLWLSGKPFYLSQSGIAWVALAGVAGAIAPPIAGRLADNGLSMAGTAAAMLLAATAFLMSDIALKETALQLPIVVLTAILLDFSVSANLVFSQRAIYALAANERSRINAIFMACFFAGGAAASALSGWCFARFG